MKALVIEASQLYQMALDSLLSELNYKVFSTETANEACQILKTEDLDLLILPMFLSDIQGATFCSQLRSEKQYADLPIFMLTSSQDKQALDQAMTSGVTEIFHKDKLNQFSDYLQIFTEKVKKNRHLSGQVLYVEDNLSVAERTKRVLQSIGLKVDHFPSAESALVSLSLPRYDLVLTDIILGKGMSGLNLVRILREKERSYAAIPILAMTGFDDATRRIELLRSGVNDCISKPVLDEELIARVNNLVSNKKLMDKIKWQEKQLRHMAMTDQLTSLSNRHYLMAAGPERVSQSNRHKIHLSMLVVDLDSFKEINDQYGHERGDQVLSEVGGVLKSSCRREDIAARFGGEEFLLLLSHCNESHAIAFAERLRKKIADLKPGGVSLTASFGVASLPLDRSYDFFQLFSASDKAVYEAKSSGKNCVRVCPVIDIQGSFIWKDSGDR